MKTVFWIIKLALFFIALTFALKNTDMVTVRYYLGLQWQTPLIFVILLVFVVGAIAGVFASFGHIVRLRREISRLRKTAAAASTSRESAAPSRVVDAV
jgi:lipopolysaccharide assembly protein A